MQIRTTIFVINYVTLATSCIWGFQTIKFGLASTVASYFAAAFATVFLAAAVALHNRLPKKHTTASDFNELRTTGPYGVVRHPFYSAVIALNFAVSVASLSYIALAASFLLLPLWWYLVSVEEKDLVRVWGQKYLDYKKDVPMFFPRLLGKPKK